MANEPPGGRRGGGAQTGSATFVPSLRCTGHAFIQRSPECGNWQDSRATSRPFLHPRRLSQLSAWALPPCFPTDDDGPGLASSSRDTALSLSLPFSFYFDSRGPVIAAALVERNVRDERNFPPGDTAQRSLRLSTLLWKRAVAARQVKTPFLR